MKKFLESYDNKKRHQKPMRHNESSPEKKFTATTASIQKTRQILNSLVISMPKEM